MVSCWLQSRDGFAAYLARHLLLVSPHRRLGVLKAAQGGGRSAVRDAANGGHATAGERRTYSCEGEKATSPDKKNRRLTMRTCIGLTMCSIIEAIVIGYW